MNVFAHNRFSILIFGTILLTLPGNAALIVVPGQFANNEGPGDLAYPIVTPGTTRVQQWIRADQFVAGTTYRINGMAFRTDSVVGGHFDVTDTNFTVKLGSTTVTAMTLSTVMDNNFTNGFSTVFAGPITLTFGTSLVGPQPWSNSINFSNPFVYAPNPGNNLLVDMMNVGASTLTLYDGQTNCFVQPVPSGCNLDSNIVADRATAVALRLRNQPNSSTSLATIGVPTVSNLPDRAYVIKFDVEVLVTPEPATWAFMGLGLAALALAKRVRA